MPDWAKPLAANVVGRPGWSCYVAYDGDSPAGAGALYVARRRRLARVRRRRCRVPGPRRPERDPRRADRGGPPAGLPGGDHRDRRARGEPPVELVPKHRPRRFSGGRGRGQTTARRERSSSRLLAVLRPPAPHAPRRRRHCERPAAAARAAAGRRRRARAARPGPPGPDDRPDEQARASADVGRITVTWQKGQTALTRACSATCAPAWTRRRWPASTSTSTSTRTAARRRRTRPPTRPLRDLDGVDRRRPARPEARDRRQRVEPQPLLAAAVRERRAGSRRDRLRPAAREDLRRGQGGAPRSRCSAARSPTRARTSASSAAQTHSPAQFILDMGTAYRASKRTKPIMDAFAYHPYMERADLPPTCGTSARQDADDRRLREARLGAEASVRRDGAEGLDPAARLRRVRRRGAGARRHSARATAGRSRRPRTGCVVAGSVPLYAARARRAPAPRRRTRRRRAAGSILSAPCRRTPASAARPASRSRRSSACWQRTCRRSAAGRSAPCTGGRRRRP